MDQAALAVQFQQGFQVRGVNGAMLPGMFETDLVAQGFDKKELRKLCHMGLLKEVTTRFQGGWRNTYVLLAAGGQTQ